MKKQSSGGRGCIEMLSSRNKFNIMLIENLEQGIEVFMIAREPVNFINHDYLNAFPLDIFDKLLHGRTAKRSSGLPSIFINLEEFPAHRFLAFDVGKAAIPLIVESRIGLRFCPLIHRDARINSAVDVLIFRIWVHIEYYILWILLRKVLFYKSNETIIMLITLYKV
ncbi:MAG TPA: hypothetical protein DIS66_04560 [Candidatus Omnitrophica bacterium]|nr:hypothetical protein [Candidatus Omnitrophota bacterium]